jgi:hypothetical protein
MGFIFNYLSVVVNDIVGIHDTRRKFSVSLKQKRDITQDSEREKGSAAFILDFGEIGFC